MLSVLQAVFPHVPGQMEALSIVENMSHILDLMVQVDAVLPWGSVGVLAFQNGVPF